MAANFDRNYNVRYNITANPETAVKGILDLQRAVNGIKLNNIDEVFNRTMNRLNHLNKAIVNMSGKKFEPDINLATLNNKFAKITEAAAETANEVRKLFREALSEASNTVANPKMAKGGAKKTIGNAIAEMKKQSKAVSSVIADNKKVVDNASALKQQAQGINAVRGALEKIGKLPNKSYSFKIKANPSDAIKQIDAVFAKLSVLKAEAANIFAPTSAAASKKFANGKGMYAKPVTKPATGLTAEITRLSLSAAAIAQSREKPVSGLTGKINKIVLGKVDKTPEVPVKAYIKSPSKIKIGKDGKGTINVPISGKLTKSRINMTDAIKGGKVEIPVSAKFSVPKLTAALNKELSVAGATPTIKVTLDISGAQAQLQTLLNEIRAASPQKINLNAKINNAGGGKAASGSGTRVSVAAMTNASSGNAARPKMMSKANRNEFFKPQVIPFEKPYLTQQSDTQPQPILSAKRSGRISPLLYQIAGNTSFGARTPAMVDMAKGMGTMMAVGEAMSAVGNSFHQSIEYQNMMETVRQIQKNNYGAGKNFERDFDNMKHTVRDVGVKTSFTVSDVAGAAKFLSMAGLDMNTINAAIRPVANVALAGDLDLATTADKLTNILTAFKLKPQDIPHLSDVLVNTFTKTNTSMMQLAESAQYAAPLASLYGIPVEEMMSLIGVMGNAGIQGSMAGTTLRMMIQNILNPSKKQKGWWDASGVARVDENGKHRPITAILQDMANTIPEDQLIDYVMGQFRVTSAAGAGQLVRSMKTVNSLMRSNYSVDGVATNVGEAKMNTLKGMKAQVSSLFTEAVTRGMEGNQDKLYNMLDSFKKMVADPKTTQMIGSLIDLVMEIGQFGAKIASVWLKIYSTAPGLVTWLLKAQFVMTQIGYLAAPFISLGRIFSSLISRVKTFGAALTGAFGITSASGMIRGAAGRGIGSAAMAGAVASGVGYSPFVNLGDRAGWRADRIRSRGKFNPAAYLYAQGQAKSGFFADSLRKHGVVNRNEAGQYKAFVEALAIQGALINPYGPMGYMRDKIHARGAQYVSAGVTASERNAMAAARFIQSDRARGFGGASAVLLGDRANVRYAAEYERRAARYSKILTGLTAAQLATPVGQAALRNVEAYQGAVAHTDAVRRRAMSIYGWRGTTGRAISSGFAKGQQLFALSTLMPKISSIGAFFTGILGKLATAFGALLSPVGLATMAIGGFAYMIFREKRKFDENTKQVEQAKKMSDDYLAKNPISAVGGEGKNAFYGNLDIANNADSMRKKMAEIASNGIQKSGDKYGVMKNTFLRDIFTEDMSTRRYAKNMYDKYIKNTSNLKFEDVYSSVFLPNSYGGWATMETSQNDIRKMAITAVTKEWVGNKSLDVIRSSDEIRKYAKKYLSLSKEQQTAEAYNAMREKMNAVVNQYSDTKGLKHVWENTGVMEGTATTRSMVDSIEGFNAIRDSLNAQVYNMLELIENGAGSLAMVISNMQLQATDLNGRVAKFYLPLGNDLTVSWKNLANMLNSMGYKFDMDFWTTTSWISQIYDMLKKMPQNAKLKLEDIMKVANLNWSPIKDDSNSKGSTLMNFANSKNTKISKQQAIGLTDFWNTAGSLIQASPNKSLDWVLGQFGGTKKDEYTKLLDSMGYSVFDSVGKFARDVMAYGIGQYGGGGGSNNVVNPTGTFKNTPLSSGVPAPKVDTEKSDKNKNYQNHYSRQSARPTQIVVNIDSLARFDKTVVANSAEDKEIAEAMERKIGQAVAMLTSQLSAQLAVVGQDNGSYLAV